MGIGVVIIIDPLILKSNFNFKRFRENKMVQYKRRKCQDECPNKIGTQHPTEASTTAKYGNEFTLSSHSGCKENYSDKREQWTEQVSIIGNKHQVIIKDNLTQGNILGSKCWHFVFDIEYNKNQ